MTWALGAGVVVTALLGVIVGWTEASAAAWVVALGAAMGAGR